MFKKNFTKIGIFFKQRTVRHNIIVFGLGGLVVFSVMILVASFWKVGRTTSYTWAQTSWAGGADGGTRPTHASNQSNWTKYDAKDAGVTINGSNQIALGNSGTTLTHTTDAHWNAGTASSVTVASNSVTLAGATVLNDTSLDFDTADEGNYTQEDATNGTDFASGVAQLHATSSGSVASNAGAVYNCSASYSGACGNQTWPAFEAFDGVNHTATGDNNGWLTPDKGAHPALNNYLASTPEWVSIQYASAKTINKMRMDVYAVGGGGAAPKNFKLYGSNNGSSWTEVVNLASVEPTVAEIGRA